MSIFFMYIFYYYRTTIPDHVAKLFLKQGCGRLFIALRKNFDFFFLYTSAEWNGTSASSSAEVMRRKRTWSADRQLDESIGALHGLQEKATSANAVVRVDGGTGTLGCIFGDCT
jgi:hypothetical protein